MSGRIKYEFKAEVWIYSGKGSWHFVSLPIKISKEIRSYSKSDEEGWGRLKAKAKIGNTEWDTAIWFDSKKQTYLLPIKADVRKKEHIENGDTTKVSIWI